MQAHSPLTYHLSPERRDDFYRDLAKFSDEFLATIDSPVRDDLAHFREFILATRREEPRSEYEYLIEFLGIGLFFRIYAGCAGKSSSLLMACLSRLFRLRTRFPRWKPAIDAVRGMLITRLHHGEAEPVPCSLREFEQTLRYLEATGDFREEALRLEQWQAYLTTLPDDQAAALLARATALADRFRRKAHPALGRYTYGVDVFIRERHPAYKRREDYIFCGRREAEYHFNMFGAEILNRALRRDFERTEHKAVLLPTCMCAPGQGKCRAHHHGLEITCTGCTASCPVNRLTALLHRQGVAAYLIRHSSSFTDVLEHWKGRKDIGLVGVACVLNLLTGGYEMIKLGIPAQCVFLEYCGCRRHWHPDGIPTDLNAGQLLKIVTAQREAV